MTRAVFHPFLSSFGFATAGWLLCAPVPAVATEAAAPSAATGKAERMEAPSAASTSRAAASVRPGLAGSFLSGRFARDNQDLAEAAKYLGETLARDPENRPLMHETMRMSLLAGDVATATALAQKLADEASEDPLIATLLMLAELRKGDYAAAEKQITQAPEVGLYGVVRPALIQWLRIGEGALVGEAAMQPAIDKSGFFAPFLTYHAALMNDVLGNDAAARSYYEKASADPAITPYRVVEAFANFHARQGEWSQAQSVFDQYATANPDSSLLPDPLTPQESEVPPLIASANDGLAELYFTTASILFGEESSQETFLYLRIALALRPNLAPAQLMLANLYEQMGEYKQAVRVYDGIAPGTVFYRRGQVRKALNYEALGKTEQALKLLSRVARDNPRDNSAYITMGDMLREAQRFEDAAGAYTDAIARAEPLKGSDWPLLYARGISFERDGEWGKAEADFTRALALEPNQPDVLNYLAYSWLTMNKNVAKAREYLEIAVSARPEDAHILDSLGWANYLAGDYAAAVTQLEKAASMMPDDPTVNDHLGDAYWRVGRQNEAKFQWQRALNFKPDATTAEALRTKLEQGLTPFMEQQVGLRATDEADESPRTVAFDQLVPGVTVR